MCLAPSLAGENFLRKIKINVFSILKFKMSWGDFPFELILMAAVKFWCVTECFDLCSCPFQAADGGKNIINL